MGQMNITETKIKNKTETKTEKRLQAQNYETLKEQLMEYKSLGLSICTYGEVGKTSFLLSIFPRMLVVDAREISDIRNLSGFYAIENGEICYVEGVLIKAIRQSKLLLFKNIDTNINLLNYLKIVIKDKKIIDMKGVEYKAGSNFNLFFTSKKKFENKYIYFIGPVEYYFSNTIFSCEKYKLILEKIFLFFNEQIQNTCLYERDTECTKCCLSQKDCCNDDSICLLGDRPICSIHYKKINQLLNHDTKVLNHDTRLKLYECISNLFLRHDSEELLRILDLNYYSNVIFYDENIAKTYAYVLSTRRIIQNINMNQPSLCIGDTGVGKTSLIQYLSKYSNQYFNRNTTLKIINMSPDYDGYDLVGGYTTMDIDKELTKLYTKCNIEKPKIFDSYKLLVYLKSKLNTEDSNRKDTISSNKEKDTITITNINTVKEEIKILEKCINSKTRFIWKDGILIEAMKNGTWILLDEVNLCSDETLQMIDALLSKRELCNYEKENFEEFSIHPNFKLFACMNPCGIGKKKFDSLQFNLVNFYDFTNSITDIISVIQRLTYTLSQGEIKHISTFVYEIKQMIKSKKLTNKLEPLISGRTLIRAIKSIEQNNILDNYTKNISTTNNNIFHLSKWEIFSVFFLTQFDLQSKSIVKSMLSKIYDPVDHIIKNTYVELGYVLTPKTQIILFDILSCINLNIPILIQGDTSTGKTSMILYLGQKYNKTVIRINNHEHIEACDYLGSYITINKEIVFKESIFIKAVREGHWVIVDELNLAPSEVLEVLNRLLDDNKEIYITQTDTLIKAHPNFRLFATQNINYGGRKNLSLAFRNRFTEIYIQQKDDKEIFDILHHKTGLPKSFCMKMIQVYEICKNQRSIDCLVTLRDLFRWGKRIPRTLKEVYEVGMSIIYERQRSDLDKRKILRIFNSVFGDIDNIGSNDRKDKDTTHPSTNPYIIIYEENTHFDISNIKINNSFILTPTITKLLKLIHAAILCNEPVLLVGETGIGKTRICEIISEYFNKKFNFINLHSGTESSDFIGNYKMEEGSILWKNNLLIESMIQGDYFLVDEINLCDDAVLERMNSLLEDKREIFITETDTLIKAHPDFRLFATMNPGTDFGKRELSPALRNRFTEIYYELSVEEIKVISNEMLRNEMDSKDKNILASTYKYIEIFDKLANTNIYNNNLSTSISTTSTVNNNNISPFLSSFSLLLLLNTGGSLRKIKVLCNFISAIRKNTQNMIQVLPCNIYKEALYLLMKQEEIGEYYDDGICFGVKPYLLKRINNISFCWNNTTSILNLKKILRALIVDKGIMLEGEPGVGKTSMIYNLSKSIGVKCIRINLSEQTEMSDLCGTYLPVQDSIKFVLSDFSNALINGYWIILDEINLCSQSVIEGLNSVLDYRKKLVLPECTISVHPYTKIFGTMNPFNSLNGRKILPRSFMDRFIRIYINQYSIKDIEIILSSIFNKYKVYEGSTLRENIIFNTIKLSKDVTYEVTYDGICFKEMDRVDDKDRNRERVDGISDKYRNIGRTNTSKFINNNFVFIHSQIPQIEKVYQGIYHNIPIILTGSLGRNALSKFMSDIFNLAYYELTCHREMDTGDLLGQYHKDTTGFIWKNSLLIDNVIQGCMVVLQNPEYIEKCIFDRCNSLFESDRCINIYEKGIDTEMVVHSSTRFIMHVDNIRQLSPAIKDRCLVVELCSTLSYIDIWKMFNYKKGMDGIMEDDIKHKKLKHDISNITSNVVYEEWLDIPIVQPSNLRYDIRKFIYYKTIPSYLNKHMTNVWNEILENKINDMFYYKGKDTIFDKSKMEYITFYESINYNIKVGSNDIERIRNIIESAGSSEEEKCLTFIRNGMLDIIDKGIGFDIDIGSNRGDIGKVEECITNISNTIFPYSFYNLKERFISSIKNKTLGDIPILKRLASILKSSTITFNPVLNSSYFDMLYKYKEDPLYIYKEYILYKKNKEENEILRDIHINIKNIYKYNTKEKDIIRDKLEEYKNIKEKYEIQIKRINKKLERDLSLFKKKFIEIDFLSYITDESCRIFFDQFSDLFDYYLMYLFYEYYNNDNVILKDNRFYQFVNKKSIFYKNNTYIKNINTIIPISNMINYTTLVANLLIKDKIPYKEYYKFGEYLCKYIYYNKDKNIIPDLILEAYTYKNIIFNIEDTIFNIPEVYLDMCMDKIFNIEKIGYLIERRNSSILISEDIVEGHPECSMNSIFSKPVDILEYTNTNNIYTNISNKEEVFDLSNLLPKKSTNLLERYFMKQESISWIKNYQYYVYLLCNAFTPEIGERYFLDCLVHEFYDRMYFSQAYALVSNIPMVYNLVLQYKAFEIEEEVDKQLREGRKKIKKEPKMYKNIRRSLIKYLTLPVTNILEVVFNSPGCLCDMEYEIDSRILRLVYKGMDNNNKDTNKISNTTKTSVCSCLKFINLSNSFNRSNIRSLVEDIETCTKQDIINRFYTRIVEKKFSYSEICLSKAINKITDDQTHLKLLSLGIQCTYPPFLFFIFNFSTKEEQEDGCGIKGGTGEKNVSDQIQEQEEISEEYCNKEEVQDDDGVECDNEGDMSTVSEEEEGMDEGVDDEENGEENGDSSEKMEENEEMEGEKEDGKQEMEEDTTIENNTDDTTIENNTDDTTIENNTDDTTIENNTDDTTIEQITEQPPEEYDNNLVEYKYNEGQLNQNQTCDNAEDYERRVSGTNEVEETPCPGQGEEEIQGTQKEGNKVGKGININIEYKESHSDKLVFLLRNILEQNKQNKYKGDYKNGKKLNMKRLIPYIASDYRKDKIWMKRRKNDNKEYSLRIFIDNSKSMYSYDMISTLYDLFSRIKNAFNQLGIPVEIFKFGDSVEMCDIKDMTFSDTKTRMDWVDKYVDGINIILTDGIFQQTGFYSRNFLVILIDKMDIVKMSKVTVTDGTVYIQKYLDLFSLKYCIVKRVEELEDAFVIGVSDLLKDI